MFGSGVLKSAVDGLRRLGAWEGILFVLARLIDRLTRGRARLIRYHFVAQPVAAVAGTEKSIGKLVVHQGTPGEPGAWTLPRPAQVIERRFRCGDRCFLAEIEGRLTGCLWLAEGGYREDEVRCRYTWQPKALAAWDYDVYVASEFRLSRTFIRLWEAAHRYLQPKGVRWTLSRISAFNAESLAAHRRLGARRLGTGTFFVVGGAQFAVFPSTPYVHLSLNSNTYPELTFSLAHLDEQGSAPEIRN